MSLTKKIQVLLDENDLTELSSIIVQSAIKDGRHPSPISVYVRNLIKEHITNNSIKNKK
jgi:hypothetical protein